MLDLFQKFLYHLLFVYLVFIMENTLSSGIEFDNRIVIFISNFYDILRFNVMQFHLLQLTVIKL